MEDGFIAYVGTEIEEEEIKNLLETLCADKMEWERDATYQSRIIKGAGAIFGQVIDCDTFRQKVTLPALYNNLLYVASYDYSAFMKIEDDFVGDYDFDYEYPHILIPALLKDYDTKAFHLLESVGVTCAFASYDRKTRSFTAAKIGDYKFFYGYTKQNHEIIFSDNAKIIRELCGSAKDFPDDCFYRYGTFYTFKKPQEEIIYVNPEDFDQKPFENTTLIANIEKTFNESLADLELHKKVDEFIDQNLSIEVKKRLLKIIKQEIQKYNIQGKVQEQMTQVSQQLGEKITEAVAKSLDKISIPTIHIIKLGETELGRTNAELFHEKFEEVLSLVQLDEPVMLIGPTGSGKNQAISQIARALGLHMYYTNNASNEFKLTGFIDAGGTYRDTEFYKAFKNGGIFFLDEIDCSDPSALIVINSALANGYMAFPHETIDRHPDFRIVAAANTWGKGSDLQYVGRTALDDATLDRFDNVFFDYDRNLEKGLYPSEQVLRFMWSFRDAIETAKMLHNVSTRGIGKVYKKEINGIPTETILRVNVIRNLGQDDLNIILGNMQNIDSNNKYFETAKSLKLVNSR